MSFSRIQDQKVALRLLRNVLLARRVPNGMLFHGPSGVGKRLTAYEFAKALFCEQAAGDACDQCLACRKVTHNNHPDLQVVVPVRKSRTIDVDAIDGIIELASLKPFEAKWRVFIIQDAERMRPPAQNHLLKTLEEPLGASVFILLSEHPQFLLPTIRSRCHRVRFGTLHPDTVKQILMRERDIGESAAAAIAAIAQGQVSRALDLVDSDKREVVFDVIQRLAAGEDPLPLSEEFAQYLASRKAQVEASIKEDMEPTEKGDFSKEDRERIKAEQQALVDALLRRDIMEYLYLLEVWYRDMLVFSATGDGTQVLNADQKALLQRCEIDRTAGKVDAIEKARLYLERFLSEDRVFRDLFFTLAT